MTPVPNFEPQTVAPSTKNLESKAIVEVKISENNELISASEIKSTPGVLNTSFPLDSSLETIGCELNSEKGNYKTKSQLITNAGIATIGTKTPVLQTNSDDLPNTNNRNKYKNSKSKTNESVLEQPVQVDIVWRNVAIFSIVHIAAAYGLFYLFTDQIMWQTVLWTMVIYCPSATGITAGAHRYWSHKSFKATTPLRIILAIGQSLSAQNSIYEWSRDHRVHHKYTETNADPHNAKRGFFFAHMGWLLMRKHPDVKSKGKTLDMSDLEADPIVMFQHRYYIPIVLIVSFFIPTFVPWMVWGENFFIAFCFAAQLRYCFNLHCTWLVNSAAHLWGSKPYDKSINPSENKFVAIFSFGEGWHNYHHVFPWDYKTAEVGIYKYNFTAAFIDLCAKIGWAYDLKTVPKDIVRKRVERTGDGSYKNNHYHDDHQHSEVGPWGWGDVDIPKEDADVTETLFSDKEE